MTTYSIEQHGTGAELVCREGDRVYRLWFPSRVKALLAKAQLEANARLAIIFSATPRPPSMSNGCKAGNR